MYVKLSHSTYQDFIRGGGGGGKVPPPPQTKKEGERGREREREGGGGRKEGGRDVEPREALLGVLEKEREGTRYAACVGATPLTKFSR